MGKQCSCVHVDVSMNVFVPMLVYSVSSYVCVFVSVRVRERITKNQRFIFLRFQEFKIMSNLRSSSKDRTRKD